MKKPINEILGDFLAGRGFYIVLTVCVVAIGVSGWYLMGELTPPPMQPVTATAQVVSPSPSQAVRPPAVTPVVPKQSVVTPRPSPSAAPSASPSPDTQVWGKEVFTWPVKGKVIGDFSLEVLAYDETMGDWRTHSGMDIAADVGTKVKAVNAGKVTAVYQDDLMGTVVTVEHGDGLTSLYANLEPQTRVNAGDGLDTGEVLGTVGRTAIAEISKPAHLHFEMFKDGESVDPVNYLPKL